ncbi:MAG: peptidase U32, partial [Clostridiales bacterium]|nr:peptidase U32 [Clostridiales bacterium]
MRIPELLCPAGNYDSFLAAVNNGADAVYLGGSDFNARHSADNFSDEDIKRAVDYAHIHGTKVNITVNTLYRDSEMGRVLNFARKMYMYGADALII